MITFSQFCFVYPQGALPISFAICVLSEDCRHDPTEGTEQGQRALLGCQRGPFLCHVLQNRAQNYNFPSDQSPLCTFSSLHVISCSRLCQKSIKAHFEDGCIKNESPEYSQTLTMGLNISVRFWNGNLGTSNKNI